MSDKFLLHPYSKETQLKVKAGTKEAEALLKLAAKPKRRNKYNNVRTEGERRTYDSKLEKRYADLLVMQKEQGEIKDFREQVVLKLISNDKLISKYRIDFIVDHNDGRMELIECKGAITDLWSIKWRLAKVLIPKGAIPGVPANARLTLVKAAKNNGFSHFPQVLAYEND